MLVNETQIRKSLIINLNIPDVFFILLQQPKITRRTIEEKKNAFFIQLKKNLKFN
jgi:hypothetical protein